MAEAIFEIVGGNLQITLTDTSTADVAIPSRVLTAFFFTLPDTVTLDPFSANLDGSPVYKGSLLPVAVPGGNVGGEWAYKSGLVGAPGGAIQGISSSGFDLFGKFDLFEDVVADPTKNLSGPDSPGGLEYGITSAGDSVTTGNVAVLNNELIWNSVVFTFSGNFGGFDPSSITNVSFQYGTALDDPNVPIPEPGMLLLLGAGLLGVWAVRRRK